MFRILISSYILLLDEVLGIFSHDHGGRGVKEFLIKKYSDLCELCVSGEFRILVSLKPETRHLKPRTELLLNYFDLYSAYPDRTIAAAWDSQVKEADKTPWLSDCGGEVFTRFAACYAELRAYPAARGARCGVGLRCPVS